jgi:hypothetical protein
VDLGHAQFVRRRPTELAVDWKLGVGMQVLCMEVAGQAIEIGAWPGGADDLLSRLYGADAPTSPTILSSPDPE